jgi:hypothetical protein
LDAAFEFRRLAVEVGHVDQVEKSWAFSHSAATIEVAKRHPLASITSPTGDKLQFASTDAGLRTVGAPVGANEYRKEWYGKYLQSHVQPLLEAVKELAAHEHELAAQTAFSILRYSASAYLESYCERLLPCLRPLG